MRQRLEQNGNAGFSARGATGFWQEEQSLTVLDTPYT